MRYIIDITAKPPVMVLATENDEEVRDVGQRYANQVGRALVVATGPDHLHPDFTPALPAGEPAQQVLPILASDAEAAAARLLVTVTKPDAGKPLTEAQREALRAFGVEA